MEYRRRALGRWVGLPDPGLSSGARGDPRRLLAVARGLGRSLAQVAVRWMLEQPLVTSVIVGARNAEQLGDTLAASGWRLNEEVRERLDKISAQPHRYPRAKEETVGERRNQAVWMPNGPGQPQQVR
jgi:diketogulonate reductase-like aldo/keto reductase